MSAQPVTLEVGQVPLEQSADTFLWVCACRAGLGKHTGGNQETKGVPSGPQSLGKG